MFSNLYYLNSLLEKSLALNEIQKIKIISFAKNNQEKLYDLIKIFEDEQKGLEFIKNDYQKKLKELGTNFKKELDEEIKENLNKKNKDIINKLNNLKIQELKEKEIEDKDINLLFNEM